MAFNLPYEKIDLETSLSFGYYFIKAISKEVYMYYSRVYQKAGETLLAVCDKKVANKTFEEGKLHLFVDPSFYGGDEVREEELIRLFEEASVINLAGRMCVELAIKLGYVDPENVLNIGECSHAQVVRI